MTSERFAIPGLFLLLVAAVIVSVGTSLPIAAVSLGLGVALIVCAIHEAFAGMDARR